MKKMNSIELQENQGPNGMSLIKSLLLVVAIVFTLIEVSNAQNSASAGVSLTATVVQGLSMTVTGTLGFGTIVAGTTPAALSPKTNISAPMYTVTGNGSSSILVTYNATSTLTSGANTLTFTPDVSGASSSSSQGSSSSISSGSRVNLSGTSGSAGNYYFWLGGNLGTIPSGQAPGSYSGTFTMTIQY